MKYIFSILILILVYSCHTPEYHYKKFIDKGGKIEGKIDSVQVVKTINGKDSLVFIKLGCPEVKFPKSKTEVRQEGRTKRKAINSAENVELKKLQLEIKKVKEENKTLRTKLRKEPKINRQNNKTQRVDIRQNNKTERKKYNWFWVFVISYTFGLLTPTLFKLIRRIV